MITCNFNSFLMRAAINILLFCALTCGICYAEEKPQLGSQYVLIQPLYLMATYNSLNNKVISKETARAYLHIKRYYEKSSVAFQCEVPVGTKLTIIAKAPKVWFIPFFADRYFVELDPDLSRGLDVVLELNRGIEGKLDGLNQELFSRPSEH